MDLKWMYGWHRRILNKARDLECEAYDILAQVQKQLEEQYEVDEIDIGSWECADSPIGICFYSTSDDPCLDDCLICHGPDERK